MAMAVADPRIEEVLGFWFSPETEPRWFDSTPEFDGELYRRFGALQEGAAAGNLDTWAGTARGALALTILLDQLPRNLYRGTRRAFSCDADARRISRLALEQGFDQQVEARERAFFYLPLMHSEDLGDQQDCVRLYEALGNARSLDYAIQHRDIIARFGRFPHRNAVLARENTPDETEFLKTHKGF